MAFGINEFPATQEYDSDLNEMIRLYREMSTKYDRFLKIVEDLEQKWAQLDDKIDAAVLAGVENATQEIIRQVNITVDELREEVDRDLAENKSQMDALSAKVDSTIATLNQRMDGILKALDDALAELERVESEVDAKIADEIGKYDAEINDKIDNMTNGMWAAIEDLREKVSNITDEYPPVTNPITGIKEELDVVLNRMWYYMRVYAITCLEFDSLGLTAKQFDDLGITCVEFDNFSKLYLMRAFCNIMRNPVSGQIDTVANSIYAVDRRAAKDAYNAETFDLFDNTAGEIDAMQLTAYTIDYYGALKMCPMQFAYPLDVGLYRFAHKYQFTASEDGFAASYIPHIVIGADEVTEYKIEGAYIGLEDTVNGTMLTSEGIIIGTILFPAMRSLADFVSYWQRLVGYDPTSRVIEVTINLIISKDVQ